MKFSRKHVINSLALALKQGTTPRKLAVTCALGVVIGIFPVWGITTWICLALSISFRLNLIVIQLVNYLFFPIQLILMIPFIKAGSFVFGLDPFPYDSSQLVSLFKNNFWLALKESGFALATGIVVWAVIALPLFIAIYWLSIIVFRKWNYHSIEH